MFFAWKAICYYQSQYETIKPAMRDFFGWFGDPKKALPADMNALGAEAKKRLLAEMNAVRGRMRDCYMTIEQSLKNYEDSYWQFIKEGKPAGFMDFLGEADRHYMELAACLSSIAHGINLHQDQIRRTDADTQLLSEQHRILLDCLIGVFGADEQPQGMRMAS